MKRRTLLTAVASAAAMPLLGACSDDDSGSTSGTPSPSTSPSTSADKDLVFDTDGYTKKTRTISTGDGDKKVVYHFWEATPYVANPVDKDYQSLTVSVPVEIDGKKVDASKAPILLNLNIGGYMSSSVSGKASSGMPSGMPSGTGTTSGSRAPTGTAPSSSASTSVSASASNGVESGSGDTVSGGKMVSNGDYALAVGYVVVSPGARGRDNERNGKYFGKAPAGIVDLKAAVRYVRFNQGRIPGNTNWIVTSGSSAGGAYSALLGASAQSPLYDAELKKLGAASATDAIFAVAAYCPIADLEHADMAYEWMYGDAEAKGGGGPGGGGSVTVDASVSKNLKDSFPAYQKSLSLSGMDDFGDLTADTYQDYLLKRFLQPSATTYLKDLPDAKRTDYLSANSWITWKGEKATFTFAKFIDHVGRSKSAPAFDTFDLSSGENSEFGDEDTKARHFTTYSLRHASGDSGAALAGDLPDKIDMMNPMHFLGKDDANDKRAKHWFIRVGTSDTDTSLTVVGNLATTADNLGDDVDARMYWDAGHGTNEDPDAFMKWIAKTTGYETS